jgi:hypothetical protein
VWSGELGVETKMEKIDEMVLISHRRNTIICMLKWKDSPIG